MMKAPLGSTGHPDPRLLDQIGWSYAEYHGVYPLRRVGALTLVAARDMWARLETIDYLEDTLGPVTFVEQPSG